jgi:hypothetical protein
VVFVDAMTTYSTSLIKCLTLCGILFYLLLNADLDVELVKMGTMEQHQCADRNEQEHDDIKG